MTRPFAETTLVVASHNPGKVREIADLVRPLGIATQAATDLGLPEPEETGDSFAANARLKAVAAATAAGKPALSDDSGLAVPALDGAPGIFSARWAGPGKDFSHAMRRIEAALAERRAPERPEAHFVCALALAWPDGHVEIFEGRVDGHLEFPPRGDRGFGYDPIFVPDGHAETFAQMDPEAKHRMSHRARAFARMIDAVFPNRTG